MEAKANTPLQDVYKANTPLQDVYDGIERGILTKAVNEIAALIRNDTTEIKGVITSTKWGVFEYDLKHRPE